ncbi:relaxase/mobilization nuclease domain-containing protein [Ruminococcus sp.]|uniref:relaxase/mobilization nuclease domain-containing protein n=1 Tax=Ruminococcus sp. TaxID=41978 RepID=UPI001B19B5C8|nr:relaxase/mobilization nuclease domain-containing protein [Ruminococcus sp.]MBO5559105.1 relaxase/mobilization nuclease domain-containing protein [Ruminococcus sp.]
MPFIKTKNIHVTPNRSLRYICDPAKTQGGLNIVSVNCMPDARNAYLDMKQIYEYYAGRKFNEPMPKKGYAKVKLIHYIQSFDPKDNISIETAQKIGLDLVREMFGEDVQAVIATHDDTGKIHNHIEINVYDLKGRHFYSNKASLKKIKRLSDEICQRYGIKPFDRENHVRKPIISGYHEWINLKRSTSWKQQIRDRIDELITVADSFDDLRSRMEQEGYTFKDGKYICVKAPGQQKNVRLKTLGDNYTPERIEKRIAEHKEKSLVSFVEPFYTITTSIKVKAGVYKNTSPIENTCGRFMRLYEILVQEKITNISEAEDKLSAAEKKYTTILQQVQKLKEKITTLESEIKSANHYFDDMGIMQRRFPKKAEDKTAAAIVKQYGFKHKDDISVLSEQVEKYQTELVELNEQLSSSGSEVRKYKAIVDEYYQIFSGESYVERLVREAKDNITQDDWDNMISEQRKVILEELDALTNPPMYHLEKQIWDKIIKLRGMNVEPYEVEKLIRALAVMRIDGIQKIEYAHRLAARMKNSASIAQDKSKRRLYERRADDYERIISAVRNIDIYPPERKPPEQKKTPPKKKHRR